MRVGWNTGRSFNVQVATRRRETDVDVGDVTGDKVPDLVASGFDGKLRVYRQRTGGRLRGGATRVSGDQLARYHSRQAVRAPGRDSWATAASTSASG